MQEFATHHAVIHAYFTQQQGQRLKRSGSCFQSPPSLISHRFQRSITISEYATAAVARIAVGLLCLLSTKRKTATSEANASGPFR